MILLVWSPRETWHDQLMTSSSSCRSSKDIHIHWTFIHFLVIPHHGSLQGMGKFSPDEEPYLDLLQHVNPDRIIQESHVSVHSK
jgi:hypothetical protein